MNGKRLIMKWNLCMLLRTIIAHEISNTFNSYNYYFYVQHKIMNIQDCEYKVFNYIEQIKDSMKLVKSIRAILKHKMGNKDIMRYVRHTIIKQFTFNIKVCYKKNKIQNMQKNLDGVSYLD